MESLTLSLFYYYALLHLNIVCCSRKVLIGEFDTLIWFHCLKKNGLMEDESNEREQICQNPKKHISSVSLFLCCKMVIVCCFVWSLALRLWSVNETGKILSFYDF